MIDDTVEEIEEMQTHSSSVVAVKAARALQSLTDKEFPAVESYFQALERNSHALRRANPSHASLHTTQRQILERVSDADLDSVDDAKHETRAAIDDVVEQVQTAKRSAAKRCAERIADADVLLTHDYSSTVLSAIRLATEHGAEFEVYVTEARPRFIGRRMTRKLAELDAVDTHHIVDSAAGHYLESVDSVLVGMDCVVDDVLYNRVGTYPIAATADDQGVPVNVVGSAAKLIDGGFAFENEFRSTAEVMREPAEGFTIDNPAYDATPVRLVDSVITDESVVEY